MFLLRFLLETYFYVISIFFDKTHFTCIWVNLSRFKMIITSGWLEDMKITQELLKNSAICRSRFLLDRSSICRYSLKLERCLDLSSLRDLDYSQQRFYSKRLFIYEFCIILIRLGKPKVCVNLFGIWEPIKLLFKGGGKRKTLTLESFISFFFGNPSLLQQKKEFLLHFLYIFGFCNQAKSLAPTLKILLVFLCKAAAN